MSTGLKGQLGLAEEVTVGTNVTVARFSEFNSAELKKTVQRIASTGIRGGGRYPRTGRSVTVTQQSAGPIDMDMATVGMGLWLKHMLGNVPAPLQVGTTGIFRQIHTPGDLLAKSLTIQSGVPQTDGVVKAFTHRGCKITEWELACQVGGFLNLKLQVDGWEEKDDVALAVASYPVPEMFHFGQVGTAKIGGTVSTAAGLTTVASGVALLAARGFSLKGSNPMATDRYFLGTSGIKAEQLENDWRDLTGTLTTEFASKAQLYDVFKAGTPTALEFVFTGSIVAPATGPTKFSIILPSVKFDTGSVSVDGPGVVPNTINFTVLDEGTTNPVIQILYESPDTAV